MLYNMRRMNKYFAHLSGVEFVGLKLCLENSTITLGSEVVEYLMFFSGSISWQIILTVPLLYESLFTQH